MKTPVNVEWKNTTNNMLLNAYACEAEKHEAKNDWITEHHIAAVTKPIYLKK